MSLACENQFYLSPYGRQSDQIDSQLAVDFLLHFEHQTLTKTHLKKVYHVEHDLLETTNHDRWTHCSSANRQHPSRHGQTSLLLTQPLRSVAVVLNHQNLAAGRSRPASIESLAVCRSRRRFKNSIPCSTRGDLTPATLRDNLSILYYHHKDDRAAKLTASWR